MRLRLAPCLGLACWLSVLLVAPEHAVADDAVLGEGDAPLVVAESAWHISLTTFVGLSSSRAFEPAVLAPDAVFGVSARLEIGVVHSLKRQTGFTSGATRGGLCVTGQGGGCADIYDAPGLLARFKLADGPFAVALESGVVFVSISDPSALSGKFGIIARIRSRGFSAWFHPNIRVGLTGREVDSGAGVVAFNKEIVHLPVHVSHRASASLSIGLETGARGFVDAFGDTLELPAMISLRAGLSETLGVGLVGGFDNLIDHGSAGSAASIGFDERSVSLVFTSRI